jgi:hypothetical protein
MGAEARRMSAVVIAGEASGAGGALAEAAALGVAVARRSGEGVLLVEVGDDERRRRPTLLASDPARELERAVREADPSLRPVARGELCWLRLEPDGGEEVLDAVADLLKAGLPCALAIVCLPPALWPVALERPGLDVHGGLLRADLEEERELAALAVAELRGRGVRARVAKHRQGMVATRRSLAGLEAGGEATRRAERAARALVPWLGASGQALPLVIGCAFAVILAALVLAAIGGAVTGKGRAQRAADLAALSAVRSMRDDFDRLLAPARLPDGTPNPAHLPKREYLTRARAAAREAAAANGVAAERLAVEFPDGESFAPVRARAEVRGELDPGATATRAGEAADVELQASATAEATAPASYGGMPEMASGGGYSGPLVHRQGEGMRPDVAAAFDRMAAAARGDGVALVITSGFRSDAEQAELFAANPNPTMVAPPGQSLHRCATELDLGPASAYGWLAANAPRFGFLKRYSWEPWHFGFTEGPPPCSAAGDQVAAEGGSGGGDGEAAGSGGLPAYVPAQYRESLLRSASRWNVSAALLAAQIMAESNFNPTAVSPAGAQGIAQFMPATAAAYGLGDPFDARAAIDAQAHLMSDLLRQFGSVPLALAAYNAGPAPVSACSCVPPYPETKAYVARILGLLDGAGEIMAPPLEVRLVA